MTTPSSSAMTTTNTTSTTSHHDNLLQKLERNDSFTTWLTLSRNHLGMDLCRLSSALNNNTHITKVSCHAHFVANLSTHSLTRLLKACASLSALEELWVALPSNRSHLSSTVVETIAAVSSSNLKKLSIRGVNPEACSTVAQSLSSGALVPLEELNLYGDCSTAACLDVLQVLETTTTCCGLQKLVLPRVTVNTACCQSLARVLTVNGTLTKLDFLGGASTTTTNNATTTTSSGSKKTKACQEVVDVLASGQNTTLTSLQLFDTNPELQSALTFYTEINRANIPALLQQSTISCEEFWHVVQQGNNNSNDCSLLYHVLLQAPQWLASGFDNNRNSSSNGGPFQKRKLSPIKTSRRTSLPFLSKPVRRVATVATVPTKLSNNHVVVDKTHRRCSEPILRVSVPDLCEMNPSTEETPKHDCPTKKSGESPSKHCDSQEDDCAKMNQCQPLIIQQRSVNKTLQKTTEPQNEQTLPKWNESRPICPRYKAHSTGSVPKKQAQRRTITSTSSSFAIPLTRQENHKNTTSNNNNNGETKKRVSKVLQTAHVFGEPAAFSTPWKGAGLRA